MTRRLIALALTLAFAAPMAALCLAAAPDEPMPCCLSHQTAPVVLPCCAMNTDPARVTMPAAAQAVPPLEPVAAFLRRAETHLFDAQTLPASATRPIEIRLLTSVFLI